MKKLFLLLIALLLTSTALAQELQLTLPRTTYSQGETIQLAISTNETLVSPLSVQGIKVTDERDAKIVVGVGFVKINPQNYYIYFEIPNQLKNGTYTIHVLNALYKKADGTNARTSNRINFNIQQHDPALSIRPAILTRTIQPLEQPGFQITLTNKGTSPIDAQFSTDSDFIRLQQSTLRLIPDQAAQLTVNTNVVNKKEPTFSGNVLIKYNGNEYSVPVLLKRFEAPETEQPVIKKAGEEQALVPVIEENVTGSLQFLIGFTTVNQTLKQEQTLEGNFPLKNQGESTLHDLTFKVSPALAPYVNLSILSLSTLDPGQVVTIELTLNPEKNLKKDVKGDLLIATKEGAAVALPIELHSEIVKEEAVEEFEQEDIIDVPKEESSSRKWIVFGIIGLLFVIALVFLLKKKKEEPRLRF
ncbi:MAG: hypothetical protein WC595_05600 [Candidatus Nanoarchaeia archaeon]